MSLISYSKYYSPKSDLCQDIFRITEFQGDYLYEINVLLEKKCIQKNMSFYCHTLAKCVEKLYYSECKWLKVGTNCIKVGESG